MGILSKICMTAFEITNEFYTAVASGFLGMVILIKEGIVNDQPFKTLSVLAITTLGLVFITRQTEKFVPSKKKVVLITGCDSGLGFSLAQHAASIGYTVVATFLNVESNGFHEMKNLSDTSIIQIQMDITDYDSVVAAVKSVELFLQQNEGYSLHAVINNAGVMVFGEFEWLTENLVSRQIDVNVMGTLRFTKAVVFLLRQYQARLITITSHCAQATLPGLSVYAATKAALTAWSDGIRIEMAKYNINVITFIPGSFVTQSRIMSNHLTDCKEMHSNFTNDQHYYCGEYFKTFNVHLIRMLAHMSSDVAKIDDNAMYRVFECTLLDKYPKVVYKHESARYAVYHFLFKHCPWSLRDYFIVKFAQLPKYVPETEQCFNDHIKEPSDPGSVYLKEAHTNS